MALRGAARAAGWLRRGWAGACGDPPPAPGGTAGTAGLGLGFRFSLRMGNSLPAAAGPPSAAAAAANQIQEIISDNCVVIFSKTTCLYCKMAKKVFEGMNVHYTAVELDMNENGSQFQDVLEQMTGGRTVPRVFVNGTFVGGATDLQRLHEEGKLLPLVTQCQVKENPEQRSSLA